MTNTTYGHYTSQAGLIGIISSESIWATNIKFLNDEHEFQDALELIRKIVTNTKITPEHPDHTIHQKFIDKLTRELSSLDSFVTESIFTLSFSEETDLLSQWRGYCPENNGFCLVFDIDEIYKQASSMYQSTYLLKCVYDEKEKNKKLKDLLNSYWHQYVSHTDEKKHRSIMNELSLEVMLLASHFKHPSFSEEREQRIVIVEENGTDSEIQFREGKFSIIPYIILPAIKESIKKIYIGPTSNKLLSKKSLEMFLEKKYGIAPSVWGGLDVVLSKTPYRPW